MINPEDRVSPATYELAGMIEQQLLSDVDPNTVFDNARSIAPSAWIGYAALALTGEPNKHAAVLRLLHDPAVQERVLADLDALFAAQVSPEGLLAVTTERVGTLREKGATGIIGLKDLAQGELVKLVYERRRRSTIAQGILYLTRDSKGVEDNTLSTVVVNTASNLMGPLGEKLRSGTRVYFGVKRGDFWLQPALQRGTSPAWAEKVKPGKKRWVYSEVTTDDKYILQQVYYGQSNDYPLFHE